MHGHDIFFQNIKFFVSKLQSWNEVTFHCLRNDERKKESVKVSRQHLDPVTAEVSKVKAPSISVHATWTSTEYE